MSLPHCLQVEFLTGWKHTGFTDPAEDEERCCGSSGGMAETADSHGWCFHYRITAYALLMPFPASNGMRWVEARANLHHLLKQDFASAIAPHLCLGGFALMGANSLSSFLPQVSLHYTTTSVFVWAVHKGFLGWTALVPVNGWRMPECRKV